MSDAQGVLNREQVAFLGKAPSKEHLSAWFNACLNSACGPVAERYGDVAVVGLLKLWLDTATGKTAAREEAASK